MLTISKDQIGGLLFLCLSIVYGYYARQIAMMPGDDVQPFNAQSLPTILAILGVILSTALLLTAKKGFQNRLDLIEYKFSVVGKLLFLIVLFGAAIEWIGFAVSTVLFLLA
jgi:putative tricarboxylic transport membrane protein